MPSQWNGIKHNEIKSHYSFFSSYFKDLGISRPHIGLQRGCFNILRREDWGRSSTKRNEELKQLQRAFKLGACVC